MSTPRGTRSKGLMMAFKKAGLPRSLQLKKKDRTAAYHAKEAFMKEAMARHLAAAVAADAAKTADPTAASQAAPIPTAAAAPAAAATANAARTSVVDASGTTVTYSERTSAADIEATRLAAKAHVAKLKSKMGTAPGQILPGLLKYEGAGASKAGAKRKKSDGDRSGGAAGAGAGGAGVVDKDSKIGHLMKPLKGNEVDFSCQVDTNVKLPEYARGKMTVVKKRKKNKKRNAREARSG